MQAFFRAHAALEAQKNSEAVEAYGELLPLSSAPSPDPSCASSLLLRLSPPLALTLAP